MAETITVKPWRIYEVDCPLQLSKVDEPDILDTDRAALQRLFPQSNLLHQTHPYLTVVGMPLSFNPESKKMLFGYPLDETTVDVAEMCNAFYSLSSDVQAICGFIERYGLFIPFVPLTLSPSVLHLPSITLRDLDKFNREFRKKYTTLNFVPYVCEDVDEHGNLTLTEIALFGKWLYFFELFRLWHAAALSVQVKDDGTGLWHAAHVFSPGYPKRWRQNELQLRQMLFRKLWRSCHVSDSSFLKRGRIEVGPDDWSNSYATTQEWERYALLNHNRPSYPCAVVIERIAETYRVQEDTPPPPVKCCTCGRSLKGQFYEYHILCAELGHEWRYCYKHFQSGKDAPAGVTGRTRLVNILNKYEKSNSKAAATLESIRKEMRCKQQKHRKKAAKEQYMK
ncbi:hypothetical protein NZD89_12195 [Alicyclobacillus fastidiosus]|uniref:Uncharacterized protein n=1 Tax=Alicyclobacillus fastidiosus TaxID=392011 RepID=A0ABY6ZMK2_9BACL|nr:hypothetical protein [Alicyclobacillus fastidiosus]WAH44067.1 hypothetical protein NZD89_12195 [Alicyclobacillus fastidiosus]